MARRRRRQITKASSRPAVAPAATFTAEQVAALLSTRQSAGGQVATPLPRLEPMVPFGPGRPIEIGAIDPLNPTTGRPEPRLTEYPVSSNLPGISDRLIPWKVLRDAADIPVVRDCIRIRKNEVTTLEWDIVVSKRALAAHRKQDPSTSSVIVERALREKLAPETDRALQFWRNPDFQQGESFVEWATKLMEEHLVLDAVAIYPFRNRGGDRLGLRVLDGSTIKVLRDHLGGRPMPPNPAYQQLVWGFPRGEYVADIDNDGDVISGYDSDRLIYKRREVRTITPYGFSAVEQSLQDVDLYLRRMEWDKAQYTDGVAPAGWIKNTGMEQWTPEQLLEYNRAFNAMYAGQTLERMRYHLLPPGMEPMESQDIPEKFKPDYHLHLIKLVAMHFDVTLAELGFTESKGLGSSGYHEGQENVQERKATNPTLVWLQSLLTEIQHRYLGIPEELEFRFLGLDAEDQAAADAVIHQQLVDGRITWNESREEMGRAPYDFDEANMPVVQNGRGLVFVEGASKLAAPGEEIGAPQAPPVNGDEAAAGDTDTGAEVLPSTPQAAVAAPQNTNGKPSASAVEPKKSDAVKAELAAYGKWLRNGREKRRPFEFEHVTLTEAMLNEVDLGTVVFKAGGGAGPKARTDQHWPAWEQDLRTAKFWAGELRDALSGVPTRTIAARWLEVRKDSNADRRRDAKQWLLSIGWSVSRLVRRVLRGLYVDGFLLGNKSAQALLENEERVDWGAWKPGSTAETRLLVAADGLDPGLQRLLQDGDRIADGINGTRVTDVAKVLADAIDTQPTVDELDAQLAEVLTDEAMIDQIAVTETTRAVADGALARYDLARLNGLTHLVWETDPDKPCPICVENADAGPVPIGTPFPSGAYSPPQHPRCFPAGVVVAGSSVVAATMRAYEGDLVTVVFSGGQEVPVTPNHPVLTPDGWVAAGDLHKGSQVFRTRDVERVLDLVYPDDRQAVSRIEDVAASFGEGSPVVSCLVPLAAEDFHGDGAGSDEVEVVFPARDTKLNLVAERGDHRGQGSLKRASRFAGLGPRDSDASSFGDLDSTARRMRRIQHPGAFGVGSSLPSELHGLRSVAAIDAGVAKHAVDGVAVDSMTGREGLDGLSTKKVRDEPLRRGMTGASSAPRNATLDKALPEGLDADAAGGRALGERLSGSVELDRVVEIRRIKNWVGHVYNLETVDGWYFADGIVAHNCRCAVFPALTPSPVH